MEFWLIYLIAINLLSFYCIRSDKKRGRFSRYSVGKRTLLILSVLGGSIGTISGMYYYKYSLNMKLFKVVLFIIPVIHVILFLLYVFK